MTTATSRMSMIDVQLPLRYVSKNSRIAFSTKVQPALLRPRDSTKGVRSRPSGAWWSGAHAELCLSARDPLEHVRMPGSRPVELLPLSVEDLHRPGAEGVDAPLALIVGKLDSVQARDLRPIGDQDEANLQSSSRAIVHGPDHPIACSPFAQASCPARVARSAHAVIAR